MRNSHAAPPPQTPLRTLASFAYFAFAFFALSLPSLLLPPAAQAQDDPAVQPQIVRLSLVEGDVRLQRGKASGPNPGGWAKAKTGVPLESGFSLVTGNGRAEIEFEDSSTLYLDANSALTFNLLSTVNDAPQTALTLLTGTLTVHITTTIRGERYILTTPEHNLYFPYPDRSDARVTSYLDGMDVTPLSTLPIRVYSSGSPATATAGHTLHYTGAPLPVVTSAVPDDTGFDAWVHDRIQQRNAATLRVMHDAGLPAPVPGLAELDRQGQFFACAPYGTCWAPNGGWLAQHSPQLQGVHWEDNDDPFPCWVGRYRDLVATDPLTRKRLVLYSGFEGDYGYNWTVCHAGAWLHREHHWVWVVGRRLHHRCPVRWVEHAGRKGFVPVHPKDAKGTPPENLKHGLYAIADKKQGAIELVPWMEHPEQHDQHEQREHEPVKLLAEAPKDFRKDFLPPLTAAEAPRLEARLAPTRLAATNLPQPSPAMPKTQTAKASTGQTSTGQTPAATTLAASTPTAKPPATLTFNPRSQTFLLSSTADRNGHPTTVTQPFGGRTDAAAGHNTSAVLPAFAGGSSSPGGRSESAFSRTGSGSFSASSSHTAAGSAPAPSAPSAPAASTAPAASHR